MTNIPIIEGMIRDFELNNNLEIDPQFKCLIEEIGELSEAMLQKEGKKIAKENKMDTENISVEIGDIIFVCITIAALLKAAKKNRNK